MKGGMREVTATTFAIEYLRPDGWWEAGRGWDDREHAEGDAREQLGKAEWRVREVGSDEPPAEGIA